MLVDGERGNKHVTVEVNLGEGKATERSRNSLKDGHVTSVGTNIKTCLSPAVSADGRRDKNAKYEKSNDAGPQSPPDANR